ncbi:MAG TPA: glycine betaine ABC transporter substrate-binding protein [Burkholderiales bacterium]|nr:glycine betaine ABC transporter substrate-binding protein [Burkholderiales bacterium]
MSRRSFLKAGAGALIGASAWARADDKMPIILGQVSLSFYAVTGAVVHEVLERLGHVVEVRPGPHDEIFPMLGQGAIDLMAACWLPEGHAAYWAKYGENAVEVATLYDGARFFWAVPDYIPESEVASIADLAKPEVAQRMTRLIQGIGTAAVITTVSQKAVGEYGLDALGYSLRPGKPAEWIGAYDAAVAEQRWIVFPTWAPQYLNRGGKLRPLQDPRGVLGGVNHALLVAPRGRFEALPAATRAVLARIELGLEGVTEMDWLVNVEKKTPREAARTWMQANESRVAGWLKA